MDKLTEFKHDVRLPRSVSAHIIHKNETAMISFWLSLKSMYAGGAILNYKNRIPELATYTGVCKKTVQKYLKKILSEKLAYVEGTSLMLRNKNILVKRYSVKLNTKYIQYNSYLKNKVSDIKLHIRAQAIKDNQNKQKAFHDARLNERVKNVVKAEAVRRKKIQRALNTQSFNKVHAEVKQSQQTVANIYGCKSKASGNYWSKKLEKQNLISIQKQESKIIMTGASKESYRQFRNAVPEFAGYYLNGKVYQYLPNQIRVNL